MIKGSESIQNSDKKSNEIHRRGTEKTLENKMACMSNNDGTFSTRSNNAKTMVMSEAKRDEKMEKTIKYSTPDEYENDLIKLKQVNGNTYGG